MKKGIQYEIKELNEVINEPVDLSDIINKINDVTEPSNDWSSEYLKMQLHYSENFTVKELQKICDYYTINKRNLKKNELVDEIIIYESNMENKEKVENRKLMWFYINELKSDKFFKKFIIWE
tara:strand:+ start:7558 stop:7923 length:366 start_codon:yes stop_codon:yes gene_type:complete